MRKLMWFAFGFGLSILIGMYGLLPISYLVTAVAATGLIILLFFLKKRFPKIRLAVVILAGCVAGSLWMDLFDRVYLSTPRKLDGSQEMLTVTATDYSRTTDYGTAVEGTIQLDGKIYKIQIYLQTNQNVSPGDRLSSLFTIRATLPGCRGQSDYQTSDSIFLTLRAGKNTVIEQAQKFPWYGYPAYVRETVKDALHRSMPEGAAGFAVALLLGDKEGVDYETDTAFKISGISHIIAVSGLHVTILFSLVYVFVGKKRSLTMVLGIPVLFFFAAVAGFSPSIMRACIMHSLMIIALFYEKEYDPPTALGFAVLVMLLLNPWTVKSVSFQLSVVCMIGILLFTEPIRSWLMDRKYLGRFSGKGKKVANGFASSVAMSVGATITVTPLCGYYFGMVSLVGTLTNLLTLWLVTFIFYGCMAVCLAALMWPALAGTLGWIVAYPIRYVIATAKLIARFPLACIYTDSPYILLWLVFAYILFAAYLMSKEKKTMLFAACVTMSLSLALVFSWTEGTVDSCRVTVLDVGQGQCILLQSNGKTFVVDCGGDSDTRSADTAANALMSQGVFKIDGLILTHYDRDHAGGVSYLLSRIPAETIYLPDCPDEDGTSALLSDYEQQFKVSDLTVLGYDTTKITLIPSENSISDNESGLCVLFQTKNCDILITGDRSVDGEEELLSAIELPELEVLIVGHHGSKYSTGQHLLDVTKPEIAIISVGENNYYGHPTQEVLDRLTGAGCEIYRTDLNGKVVYRG